MLRALALTLVLLPYCAATCKYCQTSGPQSSAEQPSWFQNLQQDRNKTIATIGFKGGVFDTPELLWTQQAWIQPQMHPYDRFFYDYDSHTYTVDRYLDDLINRYGSVASTGWLSPHTDRY